VGAWLAPPTPAVVVSSIKKKKKTDRQLAKTKGNGVDQCIDFLFMAGKWFVR